MPQQPAATEVQSHCARCGGLKVRSVLGLQCPQCLMNSLDEEFLGGGSVVYFGEYELHEELGRGGMGVVYRAWQPRLKRWVALKMLVGGMFSQRAFLERFRMEALAAARLRHPGIAVVFDVGEVDEQPYYTMELLEGGSLQDGLAKVAAGQRFLPVAALMEKTALAVAHAHEKGVLHRDLKPSNLLLTQEGEPKVLDFGLAVLVEESEEVETGSSHQIVGTPAYMAPEVARGERAGMSADIYALGAVLFEALTGEAPHQGANLSEVLARAREAEAADPLKIRPDIAADLAAICRKCLERLPEQRYETAKALAQDLQRFQEGRPVLAHPVSVAGQVARWAARNRLLTVLTAAFVICLLAGGVAVFWQGRINRLQGIQLNEERSRLGQVNRQLQTQLYASDVRAAAQDLMARNRPGALRWLERQSDSEDRGLEWHWLMREAKNEFEYVLQSKLFPVAFAEFSSDGRWITLTSSNGEVRLLSRHKHRWRDVKKVVSGRAQLSSTVQRLYACQAGRLVSWAVNAQGALSDERRGPEASCAMVAGGGKQAIVCAGLSSARQGGGEGKVTVLDLTTEQPLWILPTKDAGCAAIAHDGATVATASRDGAVTLWNVPSQVPIRHWDLPPVDDLVFSADGHRLAACGQGKVWILEVDSEKVMPLPHPPGHLVTQAELSPNGGRVVTGCTDSAVRVWDLATDPPEAFVINHHDSRVWSVNWSPDGHFIISGCRDGLLLMTDLRKIVTGPAPFPSRYQRPLFSSDGSSVLVAHGNFPKLQIDQRDRKGKLVRQFPLNLQIVGHAADRAAVFHNFENHSIELWPPGATKPARSFPAPAFAADFACQKSVSPDGLVLCLIDNSSLILLMDLRDPARIRKLQFHQDKPSRGKMEIRDVAWSPDSRFILVGTNQPPFKPSLIDTSTLSVTALESGLRDTLSAVAFSPDQRWAAAACVDGKLAVWDLNQPNQPAALLDAHKPTTADVVFAPDGRTLLSLGIGEGIAFWQTATWRELARMPVRDAASHFALSPDGRDLVVTCGVNGVPDRARWLRLR